MKKRGLCLLLALMMLTGTAALATSLPGLDALTALAKNAKITPLALPEVFEITYRTPDGELTLSRDVQGNLIYTNGETAIAFVKNAEDSYFEATPTELGLVLGDLTPLTFAEVKEKIADIWNMIEPHEQNEHSAITAVFDKNAKVAGREANRFHEAKHTGSDTGYSVAVDAVVWYTFDKETGVCLMKETAPDEDRADAEVVYECVSYTITK